MKYSKKILIVAMSMIMIISFILPVFATDTNDYLRVPPDDLGVEINSWAYQAGMNKYYIRVDTNTFTTSNINFVVSRYEGDTSLAGRTLLNIKLYNGQLITQYLESPNGNGYFIVCPMLAFTYDSIYYYIPIYCYNSCVDARVEIDGIKYYRSTTTSTSELQREAFEIGYQNGYQQGYIEGVADSAGYQSDLNLVEHCEQLLGTFVGNDYAHYITPLCLALVVILVYFLFIRWLLALVKSKNVTRVADIIVCTACIIMLVIMYAPMLDLTIHQAQTVYQIAADTVVGG